MCMAIIEQSQLSDLLLDNYSLLIIHYSCMIIFYSKEELIIILKQCKTTKK